MSGRYVCPGCWRTPLPSETLPSETLPSETVAPEPAPAAAVAPAEAVAPLASAAPAERPKPRAGLHWVEDPNPPAPSVAAAAAPAARAAAEKAAVLAAAAPAGGESKGRKKWSAWVDSLLGEADEGGPPNGLPNGSRGPADGELPGAVLCRCGAPLGAELLLAGRPALLGFAGPPESGKGFLLLSMLHQLELADGEAAEDAVRVSLDALGEADEVFRELRRELFRHGRKPAAAAAGERRSSAGYAWRLRLSRPEPRDPSRRREQPLPGGRAQLLGLHRGADAESRERYHTLLNLLIFTIDGAALGADLALDAGDAWSGEGKSGAGRPDELGAADLELFSALCARLGPRCREVSLAIVVTKSDLLAQSPEWAGLAPGGGLSGAERPAAIARLLKECWRGPLLVQARDRFRRVGLFACSSLGFRPQAEELNADGSLQRRPRPDQVLEPFHFLLADVLPRRRA